MKLEQAYTECLEIAKEFAFKKVIWLDTHYSGVDWSFGDTHYSGVHWSFSVTIKIGEEFKIFPFYSFMTDGLIDENISKIKELCNTNTENRL